MKKFFQPLLVTLLVSFAPAAFAGDACLKPGSAIEVTGVVDTFAFHHAGNGQLILAEIVQLDKTLCVKSEDGTEEKADILQLLPEDYQSFRKFTYGERITLKGKLGYPGDTAWYTPYYLLQYPAAR